MGRGRRKRQQQEGHILLLDSSRKAIFILGRSRRATLVLRSSRRRRTIFNLGSSRRATFLFAVGGEQSWMAIFVLCGISTRAIHLGWQEEEEEEDGQLRARRVVDGWGTSSIYLYNFRVVDRAARAAVIGI